eukprot:g28650.t1
MSDTGDASGLGPVASPEVEVASINIEDNKEVEEATIDTEDNALLPADLRSVQQAEMNMYSLKPGHVVDMFAADEEADGKKKRKSKHEGELHRDSAILSHMGSDNPEEEVRLPVHRDEQIKNKHSNKRKAFFAMSDDLQLARTVGGFKPEEYQRSAYDRVESVSYERLPPIKGSCSNKQRQLMLWAIAIMIGLLAGLWVNGMLRLIYVLQKEKEYTVKKWLKQGEWMHVYGLWIGIGIACACVAVPLTLVFPALVASGIPSVLAHMNGVVVTPPLNACGKVTTVFGFEILVGKTIGTVFAMLSGLFVGPEGPIIHIGTALGKFVVECFHYMGLRLEKRHVRDFYAIGAAAGIAAAFSAPLGGVMFVMEEAASFMNMLLIEFAFVACVAAYWLSYGLQSAKDGHVKFETPATSGFCSVYSTTDLPVFLLLALLGGLIGAAFNELAYKLAYFRSKYLNAHVGRRIVEAFVLVVFTCAVSVALSQFWVCRDFVPSILLRGSQGCMLDRQYYQISGGMVSGEYARRFYTTQNLTFHQQTLLQENVEVWQQDEVYLAKLDLPDYLEDPYLHRGACKKGQYNELATLFLQEGTVAVKNLFARGAPTLFSPQALSVFLVVYFSLAVVTTGIAMPSGLFIPFLLIGACMGRLVALGQIYLLDHRCPEAQSLSHNANMTAFEWQFGGYRDAMRACSFPDPGAYAIIGSAAVMGGTGRITVRRITVFLAVVLLELTNDIKLIPPIAVATLVSMWIGNMFNNGIYHAMMKIQAIPFLNPQPSDSMNYFKVSMVMAKDLVTLPVTVSEGTVVLTREILRKLLDNTHNAYPVVKPLGLKAAVPITDGAMLKNRLENSTSGGAGLRKYGVLLGLLERHVILELLQSARPIPDTWANLRPLCRVGVVTVFADCRLAKAYDVFRMNQMRHLCILDHHGHLVGMVTRKDLMKWRLEQAVEAGGVEAEHDAHRRKTRWMWRGRRSKTTTRRQSCVRLRLLPTCASASPLATRARVRFMWTRTMRMWRRR